MPDPLTPLTQLAKPTAASASLPEVTLEVRQGAGRMPSPYVFANVDFLIGTVPGCDLRISGTDLPAVLCILARHPQGLTFRKLAPTQALLVNGKTASHCELKNDDRLTLGATDI